MKCIDELQRFELIIEIQKCNIYVKYMISIININLYRNMFDSLSVRRRALQGFFFVQAMADAAHPALILETRKTAPGLRLVDKWAVYTIFSFLWLLYHVI